MTIFRIARYQIRPEALEPCKKAIAEIVADVQANEPKTLQYTVAQAQDNPFAFVHCSAYADTAAFEQHLTNALMLDRIQQVLSPAMTAPPQFEMYEVLDSTPGM